jgi:tetratricopeptide (TPR) repeat protein
VEADENILRAAALVRSNLFEEADRLVSTVPQNAQITEGAGVFRSLGGWHATRSEWQAAAQDFAAVERANQSDGVDAASYDYAADTTVRIMANDLAAYDKLRRESLRRFADTFEPAVTERFLQNSLLTPPGSELLAALRPQAEFLATYVTGVSTNQPWLACWQYAGLGLYYYRAGKFAESASACKKSLEYINADGLPSARVAYVNLVLAMCEWEQGQKIEARGHFETGNQDIQEIIQSGYPRSSFSGNWFDWVFAEILRDEARALLK